MILLRIAILAVAVLFVASMCRAEEQQKSICGFKAEKPNRSIDYLAVGCVDFELWRGVAPDYPWPKGTVTQVLVHVAGTSEYSEGQVVRVQVDNEVQFTDLIWDKNYGGRWQALVQFQGTNHKNVNVKVLAEVK